MLILGFSGKKQSGKGVSCKFVSELFAKQNKTVGMFPLASPLKKLCMNVLGLTYQQCYGTDEDKNSLTLYKWENLPHYHEIVLANQFSPHNTPKGYMTARQVMQEIGTGVFRRMNHDIWVDACIQEIKYAGYNVALIDDIRFPNEVIGLQKHNAKVLRLPRDVSNGDKHLSECALDKENFDWQKFDYVVGDGNTSIEETNKLILNYLNNLGQV